MPFQSLSSSFTDARPTTVSCQRRAQDVDAAFTGWQQSANKSQYMTALDLPTAQAVLERILRAPRVAARVRPRRSIP